MFSRLQKLLGSKKKSSASLPQNPAPGAPLPAHEELNARLLVAVDNDDAVAIRQALKDGADINANAMLLNERLGGRSTAIQRAATEGRVAAAKALLEAGAEFDGKENPLFWAAAFGHVTIVKMLLEAGATVDLPNKGILNSDGYRTPLHMSAQSGRLEAAKLLLAAGADPLFKGGSYNDTPIDVAHRQGHKSFAKHLQAIVDDPANRLPSKSVGLDIGKRISALKALGKPLGPFTEALIYKRQRETREAQRQEALNSPFGGI